MRVPERVSLLHIVGSGAALNSIVWSDQTIVLRIAPDEVLALAPNAPAIPDDPHAIVRRDDGYAAVWLSTAEAQELLASSCEWKLPTERPTFAQGAVAGLPVKIWFEHYRVLMLVPAPYAAEFAERLS